MEELWKDIKGYEGLYQCSSWGNIRSLDRYIPWRNGYKQFRKGQIIKPKQNKNGYLQFALNKNGQRKMVYVHIIIAKTFLDPNIISETVNHKDGNKLNNRIDNLEWCSYSENNKHAYADLKRVKVTIGGRKRIIYFTDIVTNKIIIYHSINEASKNIGLSHTQILRYINNKKLWKGKYYITTDNNGCVEDIEKIS